MFHMEHKKRPRVSGGALVLKAEGLATESDNSHGLIKCGF